MAAASLWQTEYKRVECAGMRIVYVDRRFDTPAVFRYHRAAWVPVGDRVRRNGAVEIARPELHAANDCGAPGLEESKGHCKCLAVSDQAIASYRFPLGWFDFPFTDNTLLPDGNRFAIYLRLVSAEFEKVTVVAMWFPKGYFTPRERPLNYREVQQLLGRTTQ